MDAEPFRPGDTIVLPFLIVADGAIVNISDGTVSATLSVTGRPTVELLVGEGITLEQVAPPPAERVEDQVAHGLVTLGPDLTSTLPAGALTRLTVYYVNSAGVRMHTAPVILRGDR
ncbi:hypothetical protein [Enterovirga sp. CN4-39]|uniref:hypothetical protein n=1 Tax=Enterovirga sp. CN4-39 TaxID=3400910 RepID=UPI003BFD6C58